VPQIDNDRCDLCGKCSAFCQYNALLCLPDQMVTFPELCHGCGGCSRLCPQQAISEVPREIGTIEMGVAGTIDFASGLLNIGEAMSPPLIRALKNALKESELTIIDAPPGTSCPVIESIRYCDYIVLVTEPPPHEPGLLPRWLGELGANMVIAGGMGRRAQELFADNNIAVLVGAQGNSPQQLVTDYLTGNLQTGDNCCDH
jgi:ferredoxin